MDRGGTFLGVLRVPGAGSGGLNLGMALIEGGLARLHPSFDPARVSGGREMANAEEQARNSRLKVRVCVHKEDLWLLSTGESHGATIHAQQHACL